MEHEPTYLPVLLDPGWAVFGEVCDVPPALSEPGTVARSCFDMPDVVPLVSPVPFFVVWAPGTTPPDFALGGPPWPSLFCATAPVAEIANTQALASSIFFIVCISCCVPAEETT
jgi:hypothetical protein